jgi:voltage-gated potassium channel
MRFWRAAWHDTRALLSEFSRPLLTFILATLAGGWLYRELLGIGGYEQPAYIDMPYIILQMMIIEPPADTPPPEWYLVTFWYALPAIAIYIIGQGAVDFFRLFFNRSERRTAWELALASTYRNHIILVGVGHVGTRVLRTLLAMGFEVVAVDDDIDPDTDDTLRRAKVPLIIEDARTAIALRDAGIAKARSLVVCTSNDHVNLEVTMRARDLNPDIRIVTRMWDDRFSEQLKRFLNVEVMSSSDLAAPAFAGSAVGIEITQTLTIDGQDYSMINLKVVAGSFMEGQTIDTLQEDEDIDIVLHGRIGHEPDVHPEGSIVVAANDTLVLFAKHSKITEIVARNHKPSRTS